MTHVQTMIDFSKPAAAPIPERHRPTLDERFERFMRDNPHVLPLIVSMARKRKAAGLNRWRIRAAIEILRDTQRLAGEDTVPGVGTVRIDNAYARLIVQRVMAAAPDLTGFFQQRKE